MFAEDGGKTIKKNRGVFDRVPLLKRRRKGGWRGFKPPSEGFDGSKPRIGGASPTVFSTGTRRARKQGLPSFCLLFLSS